MGFIFVFFAAVRLRLWYNGDMNPSYDSGGANNASGIPGVRPGVISSGPGPSAGAGPSMGPSMSSGPSMTPAPSLKVSKNDGAKPKKGLVIAGLITIVLLIVAGVVAVVMMNGGGKNNNDSGSALKNLTNYMLYGDIESGENIKELKLQDAAFVVATTTADYGQQKEFFDDAIKYIDATKNTTALRDATVMLKYLSAVTYTDVLQDIYLADGVSGLKEYSEEIDALTFEDNDVYPVMLMNVITLISEYGDFFQNFAAGGCVSNKQFNAECIDTLTINSDEVKNIQQGVLRIKANLRTYISGLQTTIMTQILELNGVTYDE